MPNVAKSLAADLCLPVMLQGRTRRFGHEASTNFAPELHDALVVPDREYKAPAAPKQWKHIDSDSDVNCRKLPC